MHTIRVNTSKPYNVIVEQGLLSQIGAQIKAIRPGARCAIITDSNVAPLYLNKVIASLNHSKIENFSFIFNAGEKSKSIETLTSIYNFLSQSRITRSDLLIALGGGVCGDITGFAAATWLRGIDFVQLPTTLLAQIDSSVGGKTGIDLPQGKNLVGAFCQPCLVLCDPDTLLTLSPEIFADGMAEAIKYGAAFDSTLFEKFENEDCRNYLSEMICRCIDIKRGVVETDEFDMGGRMLLNFGHTLGHAIEKLSHYQISHGQAVAIGCCLITKASEQKGLCERGSADRIANLMQKYKLPTTCDFLPKQLASATTGDKKTSGGELTLALIRKIGDGFLYPIKTENLLDFISIERAD